MRELPAKYGLWVCFIYIRPVQTGSTRPYFVVGALLGRGFVQEGEPDEGDLDDTAVG